MDSAISWPVALLEASIVLVTVGVVMFRVIRARRYGRKLERDGRPSPTPHPPQ